MNYYNEFDKKKAAWLRELIKRNVVAPGIVDERSILDVQPADLDGFAQCHFFAGIGVWSYALRNAGWPDDREVWTGSCPCQPFSAAGKRKGKEDERHLFPAWFRLIEARRPLVVFGEQVSSLDGLAWLDDVRSSMDSAGYTCGALDTCSAGVGAPNIRQRLYFVADANEARCERDRLQPVHGSGDRGWSNLRIAGSSAVSGMGGTPSPRPFPGAFDGLHRSEESRGSRHGEPERSGSAGIVADTECGAAERHGFEMAGATSSVPGEEREWQRFRSDARDGGNAGELADADEARPQGRSERWDRTGERAARSGGVVGAVNGFWRDAEWIWCRDNKWRPTEPGTFPLASGVTSRVLKLRGYGDAINAEVAAAFIRSYME